MKANLSKAIIQNCIERGYVLHNGVYYPPSQAMAKGLNSAKKPAKKMKDIKTGWIDDTRNIRNKAKYTDEFIHLAKLALKVDIWPEFYFMTTRNFLIDLAIPVFNDVPVKIAIEKEGGIWMEKSGHNTGKGIKRDMEKNNFLVAAGWTLIRREPDELKTKSCAETMDIIERLLIDKTSSKIS